MNLVIPPIFFYVIGALLVIFGMARALMLGRRRPGRELKEDDAAALKTRRRHLTFGVVWIAMGIFLIVSTAHVLKVRSPF
jgi:hypothetical protein